VRRAGREAVGCIILGRGEDEEKVRQWLTTPADVVGFIGFAVGRTDFRPVGELSAPRIGNLQPRRSSESRYFAVNAGGKRPVRHRLEYRELDARRAGIHDQYGFAHRGHPLSRAIPFRRVRRLLCRLRVDEVMGLR
jgi:hypothetical protein